MFSLKTPFPCDSPFYFPAFPFLHCLFRDYMPVGILPFFRKKKIDCKRKVEVKRCWMKMIFSTDYDDNERINGFYVFTATTIDTFTSYIPTRGLLSSPILHPVQFFIVLYPPPHLLHLLSTFVLLMEHKLKVNYSPQEKKGKKATEKMKNKLTSHIVLCTADSNSSHAALKKVNSCVSWLFLPYFL